MDTSKPTLDLEKELTCSICTELLYQPLTLLDCLHTYCGACLKDWFAFQELQAENAPSPPPEGTPLLTCPSCRAAVRDTRHNATVATLLDMFVTANPEKGRTTEEKEDLSRKYKPGDQVVPRRHVVETPGTRRLEEEDRRLIEEVREMSLRDAGVETSSSSSRHRRRGDSRTTEGLSGRSRDASRESHHSHRHEGTRRRHGDEGRYNSDQLQPESRDRRRHRSDSRQRAEAMSEMRRRQVEHQSSLRSLISSDDLNERDFDREIEEFARQIQEEGLLDGLDLDNIDLNRNDELSRKITEAYRRRQRERERERPRLEHNRRSNASVASRQSSDPTLEGTPHAPAPSSSTPTLVSASASDPRRPGTRQRPHSRSASATGYPDDRSRPPPAFNPSHLDVRSERRRRSNSSGGRSATTPLPAAQPEARPTTRSQTDLSLRTRSSEPPTPRSTFTEGRSSSTPSVPIATPVQTHSPTVVQSGFREQSFANRVTDASASSTMSANFSSQPSGTLHRPNKPSDLAVLSQATSISIPSNTSSPTSPSHHQRQRTQLYPEPSIACSRCSKQHIEYEIHYNCSICSSGNWNLCIDCYRGGKGCLHWFGFGYGAWNKWEKARQAGRKELPQPHMLTANRYLPPKITPGGAEGRRTLTTDDPLKRLESGNFCARCLAWANECYWRCDHCNQGDWGFCNDCVNQGSSCTHPLLPLTYQPPTSHTPPASPRSPQPPHHASVQTGPNVSSIGPFKPLVFRTRCDVCQDPIAPTQIRLHCFSCTSSIEPDTKAGDYDVCQACYSSQVSRGQISVENGPAGWRRCPQGHRMVVVGFVEGQGGQFRHVVQDLVGGRKLTVETAGEVEEARGLQRWSWLDGDRKVERLVTVNVAVSAPESEGAAAFPSDGGAGWSAVASWAWFPKAEDELMFPRGAEVREIEDVNGDWFFGVYMGAKGLFPSPYVKRVDR
ncbi:hypothetical protein ACHAQH_006407 [Verticillium albo-atrum]